MDTGSLSKTAVTTAQDSVKPRVTETKNSKQVETLDKINLSKDKEIAALKKSLKESQQVNKHAPEDIRARINRNGDTARVCYGVSKQGQRMWKKAIDLSDADIERRNEYLSGIKQLNAKKY